MRVVITNQPILGFQYVKLTHTSCTIYFDRNSMFVPSGIDFDREIPHVLTPSIVIYISFMPAHLNLNEIIKSGIKARDKQPFTGNSFELALLLALRSISFREHESQDPIMYTGDIEGEDILPVGMVEQKSQLGHLVSARSNGLFYSTSPQDHVLL